MNETNPQTQPDDLEQAAAALRNAPIPAGPPAELIAATLAAIENRLAHISPSEPTRQLQRRTRLMRYIGYGSLATAAAVLVGVGLLLTNSSSAVAFEKVLNKVKKAEAVTYVDTQVDPQGYSSELKYFSRGQQTRLELGGVGKNVYVFDYAKRKALSIAPSITAYELYDIPMEDDDTQAMQFLNEAKRLLGGTSVEDGTEKIDGVKTTVFKIAVGTMYNTTADYKVWVDPKTELPVRISYERKPTDASDAAPVKRTFDRFDWNPKLADDLFSLDPPKGYTEGIPGFVKPKVPVKKK